MVGDDKTLVSDEGHEGADPGVAGPIKASSLVKVFDCPNCGGKVTLRAAGHSLSVACPQCGAVIDASDPRHKVLSQAEKKKTWPAVIPLGRRGNLKGQAWECVGMLVRKDGSSDYFWREYLLFNPYRGYRWLVESDGHWSFVTPVRAAPKRKKGAKELTYDGRRYALYNRGSAKVAYVFGEFYWQVAINDSVSVEDYVSPPYMLSYEGDKDEETWSLGEYLTHDDLMHAFGALELPSAKGVAPQQPYQGTTNWHPLIKSWALGTGLLLGAQLVSLGLAKDQVVLDQEVPILAATAPGQPSDAGASGTWLPTPVAAIPGALPAAVMTPSTRSVDLGPLHFDGGMAGVEVEVYSPVDNNWMEVEGDLVNTATQEVDSLDFPIEYYYGSNSDGSWSEGDRSVSVLASAVPGGDYMLKLQPTLPSPGAITSMHVRVKRGPTNWSNFFVLLTLFSVWPLVLWWRGHHFEVARWSQSDYSPYAQGD